MNRAFYFHTGKRINRLFLIAFLILFLGVINSSFAQNRIFVKTSNTVLIDSNKQVLILHGLNLVNKDHDTRYRGGFTGADFDSMKVWGYNCVRLGISWAALEPEPEPGKIDISYLHYLDTCIQWANQSGIYVLLDMHQDLYSYKYGGNGAPKWACLDDGKPNTVLGGSWDDAYFTSPAIQTSFDHFWENKKASDSIGVQDHLINVWQIVAGRYANNPTVIGYDLLNEPFIGSRIQQVLQIFFHTIIDELAINKKMSFSNEGQLMQAWMSDTGRNQIMKELEDIIFYKKVMDAVEPVYSAFEKEYLQTFYEKAFAAIHKKDTNHLLFLEPSVSANNGVKSHLKNSFGKYMVFAPHAYDLVTDTKSQNAFSIPRLTVIIDRLQQKSVSMDVPLVIGEWGAFYGSNQVDAQASFITHMMDKMKCGDIFWSYEKNLSQQTYFKNIQKKKGKYIKKQNK